MFNLPLVTAASLQTDFLDRWDDPDSSPEYHQSHILTPLSYLFNSYLKNASWYFYDEETLMGSNLAAADFVENLPRLGDWSKGNPLYSDQPHKISMSIDGLSHCAYFLETPTHKVIYVGYLGCGHHGQLSLWFFQNHTINKRLTA